MFAGGFLLKLHETKRPKSKEKFRTANQLMKTPFIKNLKFLQKV